MDVHMVLPRDTGVTCTQGKGALYDYALASTSMRWLLGRMDAYNEVPRRPHIAVRVAHAAGHQANTTTYAGGTEAFHPPELGKKR